MNLYNQQKIIKNKLGLLNLAQELVKYLAIAEIVSIDSKNFMTNMEKKAYKK